MYSEIKNYSGITILFISNIYNFDITGKCFLINYSYSRRINNYRYHLIHITIFYDNKDRLIDIEFWNINS